MLSENEITKIRDWYKNIADEKYKNNQLFAYMEYKVIVDLLNRILQVENR